MRALYNALLNYRSPDGIQLIGMFIEKPSKRDYPDYYEVITNPMDMTTINSKIKTNAYPTLDACIADFRVMFANCRKYNEEGSEIYKDATTLEKILLNKAKEIGTFAAGASPMQQGKPKSHLLLREQSTNMPIFIFSHCRCATLSFEAVEEFGRKTQKAF